MNAKFFFCYSPDQTCNTKHYQDFKSPFHFVGQQNCSLRTELKQSKNELGNKLNSNQNLENIIKIND